jgi:hypothetical protein
MSAPLSLEGLLELAGKATPFSSGSVIYTHATRMVDDTERGFVCEMSAGSGDEAMGEFIAACSPEAVRALVRVAQCAKARMNFAESFTCVAEESLVDLPRHTSWDHLKELDDELRAALGGIEGVVR